MSTYQRLAAPALAAAAVLVVAACGTTPTHTTNATSSSPAPQPSTSSPAPQPTYSSPAPQPATSSPAPQPATSSPAPQQSTSSAAPRATTSSAAPQPNGNYPYEPGGVTYTGGVAGAVELFSIPAGSYVLNQQATYNPVNDADGSGTCLFGGELDYLSGSGGSIPLGNNAVPIGSFDPIEGPPTKANYPAGNYRLYIYPETTCSWTFELWPNN